MSVTLNGVYEYVSDHFVAFAGGVTAILTAAKIFKEIKSGKIKDFQTLIDTTAKSMVETQRALEAQDRRHREELASIRETHSRDIVSMRAEYEAKVAGLQREVTELKAELRKSDVLRRGESGSY